MTAQTNFTDAIALLEYDVEQHVTALASARAAARAATAAAEAAALIASDTAFIEDATQRVIALTQTLARSAAPQDFVADPVAPVAPAAPAASSSPPEAPPAPPPLPSFLSPGVAPVEQTALGGPTVDDLNRAIAAANANAIT